MEIVKKNLLSIILGVVALAAVVVAFVMLPAKATEVQNEMNARKQAYDQLHGLLTKERQLPSVNPDNPAQEKLTVFPNQDVIDQGNALTKKVAEESNDLVAAAVKMNRHELLVPLSLPAPSSPAAYGFSKTYQNALPSPAQGGVLKSRFAQELTAGMPPSVEEVTKRMNDVATDIRKNKQLIDSKGTVINQQAIEQEIAELGAKLPKQMADDIGKKCHIYVAPDTFEIYPQIAAASGAPDPIHIYFAQLGYWIQQDVVNAVNEVNGTSKSIAESPVKFLISIRTKPVGTGPGFITASDGQAGGDPDGTIRKESLVSPTGRVCNGLYDVFMFTVVVDVEADKIAEFLRGLGRSRFITPLWADVKAVDNATALSQGHFYGEKPMVNLTVDCEILYLRKWNAPLMPKLIQTRLGITQEAAPGAAPAAPAAAAAAPGAP